MAGEHSSSHRSSRRDDGYDEHRQPSKSSDASRSRHHHDRRDDSSSTSHRRRRSQSPHSTDPHPTLVRFSAPQLSSEDYFSRSIEFKSWLSESKNKYLDEISSSEARRYFDRFVRRWNDGKLPEPYYKGSISAGGSASETTRHKWSFTNSKEEKEKLAMVRTV